MEGLRRALLLLALAVPAGCRCESDDPSPPADDPPPPPPMKWYSARVGNLEISLPEMFRVSPKHALPGHTLFLAPKEGGHQATVLVYWIPSKRTIEEWAEFNRLKWDFPGSPVPVREQGWTTLGGRRSYYLVREEKARVPDLGGKEMPFLLIDWYVVFDGHAGYVRGIALQNRFPFRYRPIFEEIARRLRYVR